MTIPQIADNTIAFISSFEYSSYLVVGRIALIGHPCDAPFICRTSIGRCRHLTLSSSPQAVCHVTQQRCGFGLYPGIGSHLSDWRQQLQNNTAPPQSNAPFGLMASRPGPGSANYTGEQPSNSPSHQLTKASISPITSPTPRRGRRRWRPASTVASLALSASIPSGRASMVRIRRLITASGLASLRTCPGCTAPLRIMAAGRAS